MDKPRNIDSDFVHLCEAESHVGDGGKISDLGVKVLLDIALYWIERQRWRSMNDPDLDKIKDEGKRIIVFVPCKLIPKGVKFRQELPARIMFAHWSQAVQPSKAVTPSNHSLELQEKHGGFWASDKRGIRPIQGVPAKWMYEPEV